MPSKNPESECKFPVVQQNSILALTHLPSPRMAECELTHLARSPINVDHALEQHRRYCSMLRECGAQVITLDVNRSLPDCTFIEDTAVVLDEIAILTLPGAKSRRPEIVGIEPVLQKYRPIQRIEFPGTVDGGDVLCVGKRILIGVSSRTNSEGIKQFENIVRRYGYRVTPIRLKDCLHLKSACTALPDGRLIVNPSWLHAEELSDFGFVAVPQEEPWAADVLLLNGNVCVAAEHPRTIEMISKLGFPTRTTPLSEFAKAEGGVTCLSLVFEFDS